MSRWVSVEEMDNMASFFQAWLSDISDPTQNLGTRRIGDSPLDRALGNYESHGNVVVTHEWIEVEGYRRYWSACWHPLINMENQMLRHPSAIWTLDALRPLWDAAQAADPRRSEYVTWDGSHCRI